MNLLTLPDCPITFEVRQFPCLTWQRTEGGDIRYSFDGSLSQFELWAGTPKGKDTLLDLLQKTGDFSVDLADCTVSLYKN